MYKRKNINKEISPLENTSGLKLKKVLGHETSHIPNSIKAFQHDDNFENEEWILFGDSYIDELKDQRNRNDDVNSVLSTRLSGNHTVTHDILSSDIDDNYADLEGNMEDDENDSFTNDIRESFRCIDNIRFRQLHEDFQNELVTKVNEWKNDVKSATVSKSSSTIKYLPKPKTLSVNSQSLKKREVKKLKQVMKHISGALQKDNHIMKVEHEGVFMNNPDLESCIPSYWKRLMLDNMIYASEDHNGLNVSRDDILNKGRHFWEVEESASISTGWESGNNIVGF
ncbi:hypothetical protein CANINC_001321 [Pichia inconspicua]|uniref:Uncharacterized protein n=1 Tax=Pichia inconspicua TaxID=52247 RepID=A0A4T0X546_9ASCO|nr:hypothetical protein CANINC_001321 [[Candida] inconspicua]